MIKYRYIFIATIFLLLGLFIWRTSVLFIDLKEMLSSDELGSDTELITTVNIHDETISVNKSSDNINSYNTSAYETFEETIARIKRDVIVIGTIIGNQGEESAVFQIENMPDQSFKINTQLMDGFIITTITKNEIVLKNQIGDESFSLKVR